MSKKEHTPEKTASVPEKETEKKLTINIEERKTLCDQLNFSSAEAYKLLRTNLRYTLPVEKKCRIIGVTSSIRGEGKTTTSVNLSYTQAETGGKILLIDADMRLPSVAKKLGIPGKPGLSNVLVGLCTLDEAVGHSDLLDNWHILPAGNIPPNPSELLGGEQMRKLLTKCAEIYDTVIVDLPPVNVVSDALTLADCLDGLILVVRENYTDKASLNECMRQMAFLDQSKLLGFVMNDAGSKGIGYRYRSYGKYAKYGMYKYGKYGKYGYGRKGNSYEDVWNYQHRKEDQPAPETEEKK